ncbi:MAG TPA: HAMP domain-containing sensor histidine kinase [Myxococcales bacterium]|nr:HAMP domain-containing sensor histidine kinase [Myxococcales bacterium]
MPATFAQHRSAELGRTTGLLLHLRLVFFPIVIAMTLLYWRASGGSKLRLALICAFLALVTLHLVFLFRQRRQGIQTRSLGLSGTVVALGLSSLTGGLDSAFIIVLPATAVMSAMGGERWEAWAAAATQVGAIPLLALAGGTRPILTAAMIAGGVAFSLPIGFALRAMFERMLVRLTRTHEEILRMHSEQMESLTVLSGQIARELKAPLASIGNLSELAQQQLLDGKGGAERLELVRVETGRMQSLLEGFLNFSRPLSPLSLDTVDGVRIGGEIVDLFRGIAHERHLSLALRAESVELRCDPRKIKQVLVNLVQNAVEASTPGGEIDIEVRPRAHEAAIRVLDRGHGLLAEVGRRVFEPGVTTKPSAPGLGLTIARTIAEQHGGTLTLRPREGGGCAAELMLPLAETRRTPEGRAA